MELRVRIEKNKSKFIESVKNYGNFITEELYEFLGEDLWTSPASTNLQLHSCFPGGLVEHILKVTGYAVKINDTLPEKLKVEKSSIVKVCFLHQIGKIKLYLLNNTDWEIKRGILYKFNEELTSMKISERSLFYCNQYGIKLSDVEFQAIMNFEKTDEDRQSRWYGNMLGIILKQAIELAIYEEKQLNEKH
jgi:hypothetical protein